MVAVWHYIIIAFQVVLSGVYAGLNVGLFGLDTKYLEMLTIGPFQSKEDEDNAIYAKRILPLRKRGYLLLASLIIGNVANNSILSIQMAEMTSGLEGLLISTALIVVFGEIIPQAIMNRYALKMGGWLAWFIWLTVIVVFVVAYPVALLLKLVIGPEEDNIFTRSKFKRLFEVQEKNNVIQPHEKKILTSTLDLHDKTAETVMTPLEHTYMLEYDSPITKDLLREIYSKGYSRIPVYEKVRTKIVGILMTRELIMIRPNKATISIKQLSSLLIRNIVMINCD